MEVVCVEWYVWSGSGSGSGSGSDRGSPTTCFGVWVLYIACGMGSQNIYSRAYRCKQGAWVV